MIKNQDTNGYIHRYQDCKWCGEETTHKWCSIKCRTDAYSWNRKKKYKRGSTAILYGEMLSVRGRDDKGSAVPFNVSKLWDSS